MPILEPRFPEIAFDWEHSGHRVLHLHCHVSEHLSTQCRLTKAVPARGLMSHTTKLANPLRPRILSFKRVFRIISGMPGHSIHVKAHECSEGPSPCTALSQPRFSRNQQPPLTYLTDLYRLQPHHHVAKLSKEPWLSVERANGARTNQVCGEAALSVPSQLRPRCLTLLTAGSVMRPLQLGTRSSPDGQLG